MLTMTEPHTLTEPYTMPEEQLTATQQTAITSLILGKTVSEAAIEADVHRNTVHRWLKSDEPFQAAKHRAQRDARMAVEAKLHDTAMAAVDCIEKCLLEGDAYVAEQLLKGLGCFDGKLKNLGKDEAVELALEALQHSATSEMFQSVGPALDGQLDSASTPDQMAASNHVPTDEMSGQARTYEVQHDATSEETDEGVFIVEHEGQSQEIHAYADLTVQQTTAMFALQTGQTINEAAHCADTDPATVTQWLRGDCTFQASMNRCGRERRQSIQARLSQLASKAADVIDLKVVQGNGRVAVKVLKGLGYLGSGSRNGN